MKVGIIGAMNEEIAFFKKAMADLEVVQKGLLTFYSGTSYGHDVVITKSGVGKVNGAIAAQMLIDLFDIEALIFTGVAGGVKEELDVEDIVISTSCQQHDIDASPLGFERGTIPMFEGTSDFPADEHLVNIAYQAAIHTMNKESKVLKGKIISGDQFIADKNVVKELGDTFGGICVEMEGAAVAQVAHFNAIPYVIIRSISDKANGEAPVSFETFVERAAQTSSKIVERLLNEL
ncbi:5'-methylthioadenosine/adenosylhomocysteine nucleosidase [Bacillus tamaricis]|uniref:5'-methylthioadenosine/adenosylhomocysteine nucleosidase n=2 Tax=Evansella tamaricis TaxID=2069301 RepID=A0ABS6JLX3_9BACI|nr:5'-methylthioadenosine/adenosylhomocysteine nucleosidase [Evansella tamaricis]